MALEMHLAPTKPLKFRKVVADWCHLGKTTLHHHILGRAQDAFKGSFIKQTRVNVAAKVLALIWEAQRPTGNRMNKTV